MEEDIAEDRQTPLCFYNFGIMNRIELKDMEFFSAHGCFEEERIVGNRFVVNLSVEGDFSKAATSDNLEEAVDYQELYNIVASEMAVPSSLLENVAHRIVQKIKAGFPPLEKISVTIDKINPPLGGKLFASSVTFEI